MEKKIENAVFNFLVEVQRKFKIKVLPNPKKVKNPPVRKIIERAELRAKKLDDRNALIVGPDLVVDVKSMVVWSKTEKFLPLEEDDIFWCKLHGLEFNY